MESPTQLESTQFELGNCALCTAPARYRCPRCMIPTCSLPCSRKHKQDTGCTGERNKVQYVPMNTYGWGEMMRDYCYLEEVGRQVSEWGNEIVRGGYTMENSGRGKVVCGRGGSRRVLNGRRKAAAGRAKRDMFRAHLEKLDIDVELLPNGMERRKLNQSTFDQKSKCSLLTIEFICYPPTAPAPVSSPPASAHTIISHQNRLSTTLLAALQRHVPWTPSKSQKQKENALLSWLPPLANPHPDDPEGFIPPHCYIRAHRDFLHTIYPGAAPVNPNAIYYHKLDPTLNLAELLRSTHFVEFPTIHVFDPDASSFLGTVIDKAGSIARFSEDDQDGERVAKCRKLNREAGLQAIAGLVGEYGSEDGSQSEEEIENKQFTGLATLIRDRCGKLNDDGSSSDVGYDPIDPAMFVKQAQVADEDAVDWGDEWDLDGEE
ncbi:hypothetical protein PAXRUDRAFT_829918 [Paxillus rubicundulus Ve08.2h10]|uniref:Unplaced genomic scaffold scaffold_454, whole genome shotgun sequence n=1 Tax=Paxillus rubicundulus Ve08.2h10 TaxID=930991 RepID=A0A0D0E521_9AGAM|nr:hypothetical protein PAXRUDRAFT_829918 [Paxillus rubicundulus Ve08.2h10]